MPAQPQKSYGQYRGSRGGGVEETEGKDGGEDGGWPSTLPGLLLQVFGKPLLDALVAVFDMLRVAKAVALVGVDDELGLDP